MLGGSVPKQGGACYIQLTPQDDSYNRQRDIQYLQNSKSIDMTAIDEHTDIYEVLFINYGADALTNAQKIRNGLFTDSTRRFFRLRGFALIADVPAIRRVPELTGGSWISRADVSARFNHFVRLIDTMPTFEHFGVVIEQDSGRNKQFETNRDTELSPLAKAAHRAAPAQGAGVTERRL